MFASTWLKTSSIDPIAAGDGDTLLLGDARYNCREPDCASRRHVVGENRLADLCENHLLAEVPGVPHEDARALRHALDDERRRHDRGEFIHARGTTDHLGVVVEVLLGHADVLDRDKPLAR